MYLYFLSQVALIPKGARMRRARKKYIYGLHNELVLTFEKKKNTRVTARKRERSLGRYC
jgi:hypothetical protein